MNTTIEEIQSILGGIYIQLVLAQKENEHLKSELARKEKENKDKKKIKTRNSHAKK